MDFYETLQKRQSVRAFKDESIPEEILNRVLTAFNTAPSWANTQPWELILVTDKTIKEQLQKTVGESNPSYDAIVNCPILVAAIGITGVSGFYKGRAVTGRGDWMMFDLGIATEHLALAAATEGLGTVHVGFFDYEKASAILNLPNDRTVVELIPLGYPAYTPRRVPRKPISSFVFKNSYGKN